MIVILSPAKALDLDAAADVGVDPSIPVFIDRADDLVSQYLQRMTQAQLKSLLGVSDDLARLNHQRYKAWHEPSTVNKPCALAFNGPAYQHLRAWLFTPEEAARAQSCVRILSGLYGLLRPMDLIKPYRLDMGRKLKTSRGPDLYSHWRHDVTEQLNSELASAAHEGSRFVVNCASQEYARVIDTQALKFPVFHCLFPGVAAVHAKQARGAMVRHIVTSGATDIKGLQAFTGNDDEFAFDAKARGGPETLVFMRQGAKTKAKLPAKRSAGATRSPDSGGRAARRNDKAAPATQTAAPKRGSAKRQRRS